ncbi:hypothetical protein [Pseudomonas aeruginosa]|uniref:hypothetical protein n=1 Tax=Pseudomonas aeruginosa TaxID=287 RepID=UPI00265AE5D4|nr:hypothetical protein [Pseudomonas aeruginosa]
MIEQSLCEVNIPRLGIALTFALSVSSSKLRSCSQKTGAKDVAVSWAKGDASYQGESGKDFANSIMDYGKGNWKDGQPESLQIKKWGIVFILRSLSMLSDLRNGGTDVNNCIMLI